jgi:hypothetical protein
VTESEVNKEAQKKWYAYPFDWRLISLALEKIMEKHRGIACPLVAAFAHAHTQGSKTKTKILRPGQFENQTLVSCNITNANKKKTGGGGIKWHVNG